MYVVPFYLGDIDRWWSSDASSVLVEKRCSRWAPNATPKVA